MADCIGYHEEVCCDCSIPFQMPFALYEERLADGKLFSCPNGHKQYYTRRENSEERLKEKIEFLEHEINWRDNRMASLKIELQYQRRARAAFQGHLHRSQRLQAQA